MDTGPWLRVTPYRLEEMVIEHRTPGNKATKIEILNTVKRILSNHSKIDKVLNDKW